jgi:hypothetical protein
MALNQYYENNTIAAAGVAPYGSGGLLDSIRTAVLGTEVDDEIIDGTPNGILVSFSGTAANNPIGLGRFEVSYTVSSTVYTATDDGSGSISDSDHLTSGTITYSTGAWTLEFSTAPDNGSDITADYIHGDPGQDWKELLYQDTENKDETDAGFSSDCKEWIIQNTGKTGAENVIIGMREWWYSAGAGGGLNLNVYISFPSPAPGDWNYNGVSHGFEDYNTTWKTWKNLPTLPLPYRGSCEYWLYSNRQRIVVFVKLGGQYESMYLGFGTRYGAPSDYPHPLVAKASMHHDDSSFFDYTDTGYNWRLYIAQHNNGDDDGYPLLFVDPGDTYISGADTSGAVMIPRDNYDDGAAQIMGPTPYHGRYLMTPVYLGHETNSAVYMELDGVYHLAASGVSTEETFHANQKLHDVFQNIHRTGHNDLLAIERIDSTTTTTSTTSSTSSTTTTAP